MGVISFKIASDNEVGWTVCPSPYSPDYGPSDFHLFGSIKNVIREVKFRDGK
jgi:hypothetical protein